MAGVTFATKLYCLSTIFPCPVKMMPLDKASRSKFSSNLLSDLFVKDVDYADLYFQHSVAESWFLEEGIVKSGTYHISHGVGTRAVKGEQTTNKSESKLLIFSGFNWCSFNNCSIIISQ
jgi:hypothetical protein